MVGITIACGSLGLTSSLYSPVTLSPGRRESKWNLDAIIRMSIFRKYMRNSSKEASELHMSENSKHRWWVVGVAVPLLAAAIGAIVVLWPKPDPTAVPSSTSSNALRTTIPLPAADPIPDCKCFNYNPEWPGLARGCYSGSMSACDRLWNQTAYAATPAPVAHNYGLSCGGRRSLDKGQGYTYSSCAERFPGHA